MSSPPTTLGQYQIIREIARSNDIVYEAYDPLMNRRVAVKELAMPPGSTPQQQEDRINRFRREAQAAGTLNHPNIMTVFSFAEDAGRVFMALEYLDGQSLRSELDTKGVIPADRAIEIARAVLSGLDHAHEKGVIHRDIKPDNVQILSNGSIKITDFGIARLTFQPNLTMDGQVFGTPSYMSPEQVIGREIDARSDVFSVGVMLYEMLTGQKPFPGDSVVSITYAIMNKEPERPPQLPYPLWQVLSRALEKSTAMRYANAGEMIKALDDAGRVDALPPAPDPSPYGANPYAPPVAPNVVPYNPYAPVAPPAQAGYTQNPYQPGAAPPNPYAQNPFAPPAAGPPVTYPYNPYAHGGGGVAPHTPNSMPPPGAIPVYYPPPPRQPLLKPETAAFVKKLAITVLVLGTLFALVVVGAQALIQAMTRLSTEKQQVQIHQQLVTFDQSTPLDVQISKWEQYRASLAPGQSSSEADVRLGALYERLALADVQRGNLLNAEIGLRKAIEYDRHNPALFFDIGNIYMRQAQQQPDSGDRAQLYKQSAEAFLTAAEQESDSAKRAQYTDLHAQMTFQYAYDAQIANNPEELRNARQALESARSYARDTSLGQQMDALLASIRG